MAITIFELPGYLRTAARKAGDRGPRLAAEGMARAYQGYVVRSMRGPSPSPPGSPPARRSGTLARSVKWTPAVDIGDWRAESTIAPHTAYARIQNFGGTIWARHTLAGRRLPEGVHGPARASDLGYLRVEIGGKVMYRRSVTLPARRYMVRNAEVDRQMRDGAIYALTSSGVLLGGGG